MSVDPSSSRYVNDLKSTNCKQLLNAYVYDFLIKSSLPQTAQSFIKEADVPIGAPTTDAVKKPAQNELIPLAISLDAPQGFLYEWWQIFWDVFNARTHRGGSENAQHYYQLQLLRQHKEHALHNSTFHAAHAQSKAQAQAQAQAQLQAQLQAQTFMGQNGASLAPQQQQQLLQQQYHQQLVLQQQSPGFLQQQQLLMNAGTVQGQQGATHIPGPSQQQIQSQQVPVPTNMQFFPPVHQQYSQFGQTQVHPMANAVPTQSQISPHHLQPSLQQQEVQQHFQQQQTQLFAGQKRAAVPQGPGGPMNAKYARVQQAQLQMNQFRQQQQAGFQADSAQFKAPQLGNVNNGRIINSPSKKAKIEDSSPRGSPLNSNNVSTDDSPLPHKLNGNQNISSPAVTDPNDQETSSTGQRALQDYQLQLMALERENKKMLNGSGKSAALEANGNKKASPKVKKMPPPKKSKAATAESPALSKKSVNSSQSGLSAVGSSARKVTARRRTKKTANASNTSEPPTPTTPITPGALGANFTANPSMLRKESSTISKVSTSKMEPSHDSNGPDKDSPNNGSQLTPPNSENANNGGSDRNNSDDNAKNENFDTKLRVDDNQKGFPPEDEIISGSQMIGGSNDLYSDFPLSDFSNEISGDGNFNLETFLTTDGSDLGNFDNYWRDGVEATD